MTKTTETEPQDYSLLTQQSLLSRIQHLSKLIVEQQAKADAGEFKSYGGAIGLQRLRLEREALVKKLKPLQVITDA